MKTSSANLPKLISQPMPDTPLLDYLFFTMMTRRVKPPKPWRADVKLQDIMRIKAFPPDRISDISFCLSDHLCLLSGVSSISNDDLSSLIAAWRAWSEVFQWSHFLIHLLNTVMGKTAHILAPQDTRNLFQSIGYLIPLLVGSENRKTEVVFDVVTELVNRELHGIPSANGLAEFALVVVCTCPDEWDVHFARMCDYALSILEEGQRIEQPRVVFARSFLKGSLSIPLLREKVVDQVFDVSRKGNDCQTLVDLFIAKHLLQIAE
jgi:hypothetical protein